MLRAASLCAALGVAGANPNQFEAVSPGGDTKCFHGGEFSFMHRKGTVNKLVFEFEGGGACWNAATCGVGSCTQSVDKDKELKSLNGANSGMHDGNNEKNPFKEWYHVFIPYCTCDIHTGTQDHRYTLRTVHHRGHINFMAVLNWTVANFPTSPDAVAISGCSAGSAGALMNWPWFADQYPKAKHYVFGDSFIGVLGESQYNTAYKNWGMKYDPRIPGYAPEKVSTYRDDMACYILEQSIAAYPEAGLGFYTSNADAVQTAFYVMGGKTDSWSGEMRKTVACYQSNTTTINTFIAKGSAHCRSQNDGFFTVQSDGVNLASWVGQVVDGQKPKRSVDCAADGECKANAESITTVSLEDYSSHIPYRH